MVKLLKYFSQQLLSPVCLMCVMLRDETKIKINNIYKIDSTAFVYGHLIFH